MIKFLVKPCFSSRVRAGMRCLFLFMVAMAGVCLGGVLPPCPGLHLTEGIVASDGVVWVVGEGSGVYKLGPENSYSRWEDARYYENFPSTENFYAIAEDNQGRIWVGTDNRGVAVFNGTQWQSYSREQGLPGERVFDIAVSPLDGVVAVATSGGVCLYDPAKDTWRTLTRENGLLEDQVQSLCFANDGTLWLAYACSGVSWSPSKGGYDSWKSEQAPWYWDSKQYLRQPQVGNGTGLPSNLCNAVMVGNSGAVWLGTTCGLAHFSDKGVWKYVRGENYLKKNKGAYGDIAFRAKNYPDRVLLPEDFVTCLAENKAGIWVGFRDCGAALLHPGTLKVVERFSGDDKHPMPCKWITSFLFLPDGSVAATTFGKGVVLLKKGTNAQEPEKKRKEQGLRFPTPMPVPSASQLKGEMEKLVGLSGKKSSDPVVFLKEDWTTGGDWCQRYGKSRAELFASNAPLPNAKFIDEKSLAYEQDPLYKVSAFPNNPKSKDIFQYGYYGVFGAIGLQRKSDDSLRAWVQWVNAPYSRNVLYNPYGALRTESEWDDHGEAYSQETDGPDIWIVTYLPKGKHTLSLYFFNPNGRQQNAMAKRDYLVEIRKYSPTLSMLDLGECFTTKRGKEIALPALEKMQQAPVVCRARVNFFSGTGVYKTFLINEEGAYCIKIVRNNSFNTIVNGIFIETLEKPSEREWDPKKLAVWYAGTAPSPGRISQEKLTGQQQDFLKLWDDFSVNKGNSAQYLSAWNTLVLGEYRFISESEKKGATLLENIKWYAGIWEEEDRKSFDTSMAASWEGLQDKIKSLRSSILVPDSPGVVPFTFEELEEMEKRGIDWRQYRPESYPSPKISVAELKEILKKPLKTEPTQ